MLVASVSFGYLAVRRSENWNHFGHWFGCLSVFMLACFATPDIVKPRVQELSNQLSESEEHAFTAVKSKLLEMKRNKDESRDLVKR
jgi:hypothetical protein